MTTYQVKVVAGGELSGLNLRDTYVPGVTYTYPASDAEYVNTVLKHEGRLEITEIADPEPAGPTPEEIAEAEAAEKAKAEAEAKAKAEAAEAAKAKKGGKE